MDKERLAELEKRIEESGNVRRACRETGISRSAYYKHIAGSGEGTIGEAKPARPHPQAISQALRDGILALSREFPEWGCDRIAFYLELRKERVSASTVQKVLRRNGLGEKTQRGAR
ncbi:MAG: integrase, catalytic region [Fibrobacteres bacterium]|nr:integrase, catalytic region [Fibrobacterota bacterium]